MVAMGNIRALSDLITHARISRAIAIGSCYCLHLLLLFLYIIKQRIGTIVTRSTAILYIYVYMYIEQSTHTKVCNIVTIIPTNHNSTRA